MPGTENDASGGTVPSNRHGWLNDRPDDARDIEASLPLDIEESIIELIDTAEHLAGNPAVAREAIKAEVERRTVREREWEPLGTGEPTYAEVEHLRPKHSIGGAMPIHPSAPIEARRRFIGFDLEVATYTQLKPDLLARFPGKFVVIVGDEIEGPAETFSEALRAGYRRFGLGPLFVKQLLTVEPIVEVTRDIVPCQS
jgi:hypothetical protein